MSKGIMLEVLHNNIAQIEISIPGPDWLVPHHAIPKSNRSTYHKSAKGSPPLCPQI